MKKRRSTKQTVSTIEQPSVELYNSYKTQQIQEFREIFKMYDRSNSGSITSRTLKFLLRGLGDNVNEQQVQIMLEAMDEDRNGTIDFQQFLLYMLEKVNAQNLLDDIVEIFRVFDRDNTGYINKSQLKIIIANRLDSNLLKKFFDQADIDNQGQINYQKYLKTILKD